MERRVHVITFKDRSLFMTGDGTEVKMIRQATLSV